MESSDVGTHSAARAGRDVGIVAILLMACTAPLRAQRVQGIVLDEFSHAPVKAADVELLGTRGRIVGRELTGPDGRFAITIPKFGAYAVKVDALGYTAYTTHVFLADTSQQASVQVSLAPAPVALKGLNVTTTAVRRELMKVGFYRRKAEGFGYFLTPKQIEEKVLTAVTDVFYGLPGVRVVCDPMDPSNCDVTMPALSHQYTTPSGKMATCYPSVAIDGIVVRHGGIGSGPGWSDLVSPEDIAGIEVYSSPAGAPAWVGGMESPCGAILIWTKDH